jgi:hypothetical protein
VLGRSESSILLKILHLVESILHAMQGLVLRSDSTDWGRKAYIMVMIAGNTFRSEYHSG